MQISENFYINTQDKLNQVLQLIKQTKVFSLDTEFTRETTYYPILSIVQVAVANHLGKKEIFIIDCLAEIDLEEFFDAISNPNYIKILHSSQQDLQIFYRKSNKIPQNIVDTQVMANFCGLGFGVGYSNLVKSLFNQEVDKKQQRSNWQLRPLTEEQIKYALLDVFFLEEIYLEFLAKLKKNNQSSWFEEEMKTFVNKSLSKSDESLSKNFSFRKKSEEQIAKIKSLILWRESWAQKIDVPRQHFIKDYLLEKMIDGEFDCVRQLTLEMKTELKNILDDVEREGDQLQKRAKILPMTQEQKDLFEKAKSLIAKIARVRNFKEQFLMTSSDLKKLVYDNNSFEEIVFGWRKELFGKELKQLF